MEVTIPLKSDIWETVTRNLLHHIIFKQYSSFWFCHRIICSEFWAYWIITDLAHRSFCSSSEWWLRGIRLAWEFYYCKLNFLMLWCSQVLCYSMPVSHLNLITFSQKYIPAFIYTIFLTFDVFKAGTFLTLL